MPGPVVVLAGGTGGAKLARGMLDVVGAEELVVIANTGDDIEIYGAFVSPDPDLISFWLADVIDERGWGLADDTFAVMDGLRAGGQEVWFNLGDRDLAIGLDRARRLRSGARLTEIHDGISRSLGVSAAIRPMSDDPVRTRVMARNRWWTFQQFMIEGHGEGAVQDVDFRGAHSARATPEVLEALRSARAIVIGPSNPIISIGPILAIEEIRTVLEAAGAPRVAVSPIVHGRALKGPTAPFMQWAGHALSSEGVAAAYQGLIDGLVADEDARALPTFETETRMDDHQSARRVAEETLRFALSLG